MHTVTAGFSVGEFSALIFSGALSFDDGRTFMINDINYSPISITHRLIKQSPLNKSPVIKAQYCFTINITPINWPPLLSTHDHLIGQFLMRVF